MKSYYFIIALLIVTSCISKTSETSVDKLPESVFGEWYCDSAGGEYSGLLIQPDFIEHFYQAYSYKSINKIDENNYSFTAANTLGDLKEYQLEILAKDTIKIEVDNSEFFKYVKTEHPHKGKRITIEELPDSIYGKWYTTDGKNKLEFNVTNKGLKFKNSNYNFVDIVNFNSDHGEQYRIIVGNKKNYMMFYFKNWSDNYIQVGYHGQNGDLYKNNKNYPDSRVENYTEFVDNFDGNWYSTDGKNKKIVSLKKGKLLIDGTTCEFLKISKNDNKYIVTSTTEEVEKNFQFESIFEGYIIFNNEHNETTLLKKKRSANNFVKLEEVANEIIGDWYSTDGKSEKTVSISNNGIQFSGEEIISSFFAMAANGVAFIDKNEKPVFTIIQQFKNHLEIKSENQNPILLKRSATVSDVVLIENSEIPASLKGDWFETDETDYWTFDVTTDYFIANNNIWDYKSITYKNGTFELNVTNGNTEKYFHFTNPANGYSMVNEGDSNPKQYTKDSNLAVLNPKEYNSGREADNVFIQGYIKNMAGKNLPTTIDFVVNSVIFDTQLTYPAKIKKDGRFSLTVPKVYAQDIYVKYLGLYTMFVSPGDSILFSLNTEKLNQPFLFMGDNALTNYNIIDYSLKQRKESFANWDERRNHLENDTCFEYKKFIVSDNLKLDNFYNNYISENPTSNNFKLWVEHQNKYNIPNELMRYRWLHSRDMRSQYNIPTEYFDFIKEYPINLNEKVVSSHFKGFCHELLMYTSRKFMTDTTTNLSYTANNIIRELKKEGIEIDSELESIIKHVVFAQEKPTKEEQEILTKFFTKHSAFINEKFAAKPDAEREYYKKHAQSELYQLKLTSNLYQQIDNSDTTTLALIVPKQLLKIEKESFKTILNNTYLKYLDEARNPMVLDNTSLNSDNPSSGDSLLVQIVNKHKGKVIYIDFWATWCRPCRDEMPYAKTLKEKLKGKDVAYVYLCGSSPEQKWKQLINKLEITGDHYFIKDKAWNELGSKFGVSGIPHYVLVDKNGVVVSKKANRPSSGDTIVNEILKYL